MTDEEKRSDEDEAKATGDTEPPESPDDAAAEAESEGEAASAGDSDAPESRADDDSDAEEADPASGSGHASGNGHGAHEHLGHTAPMSLLIGVLVALSMLTILTVAVTAIDLGSQGNFIVAMVIATVKAVLVMGYFMHMFWDAKFNVVAFTSSFLFVLLFLSMALLDRGEYQDDIDDYENDKAALAP